jgi:hypothetical protein
LVGAASGRVTPADYLSGALLADCGAEGAQIINSAPIQAARRM